MPVDTDNIGVALAAVSAAGAATALGASVVLSPKLVKLASRRVLAASLGFSAGVMIYVSFVVIFQKSAQAYKTHAIEGGYDEDKADTRSKAFSMFSFFTGVAIVIVSLISIRCISYIIVKLHYTDYCLFHLSVSGHPCG